MHIEQSDFRKMLRIIRKTEKAISKLKRTCIKEGFLAEAATRSIGFKRQN